MSTQKIAVLSENIINLLGLQGYDNNTPIYLGDTNIQHMISKHPKDYQKYGADISNIISSADYVGVNQKDNSIEYVKEYLIDNEFVKVAVRVSKGQQLFARSLYILNNNRVKNYISKGTLKKT